MNGFIRIVKEVFNGIPLNEEGTVFITNKNPNNSWIIGPYGELKLFAKNLHNDDNSILLLRKHGAILGLRETDQIPTGNHPKNGFQKSIKGKQIQKEVLLFLEKTYSQQRTEAKEEYVARITDLFSEAQDYFNNITLESHHIVEGDTYRKLGKNKEDFSYEIAPCVLLKGELHRRFFTVKGSFFRKLKTIDRKSLREFYSKLYLHPKFKDLHQISEMIIDHVFKNGK